MRDKLIEFIKQAKKQTKNANCDIERNMIFADYLLENGVVVPPCKVGDEINGEVVCEMLFSETLGNEGNICWNKQVYTCDKVDAEKKIRVEHPMTWEKAERALKGVTDKYVGGKHFRDNTNMVEKGGEG